MIAWFLNFTKIGKTVKAVQDFLDGKKQYIAGLAVLLPAAIKIVDNFRMGGLDYLIGATHSPEYLAAAGALAVLANAAKGEKIRKENAVIIDQNVKLLDKPPVIVGQRKNDVPVAGVDQDPNEELVTRGEVVARIDDAIPPPPNRKYP